MEMMFMFPDEKPSEISRCKMRWKMVADHSCTSLPERIAPPPLPLCRQDSKVWLK